MTIGASWYATNSSRVYPLRATVTAIADDGSRLPDAIIADLKVRYPANDTDALRLASVYVDVVVSVVLAAGDKLVAAFSRDKQDIQTGVAYPLQPLSDGAVGTIVFGDLGQDGSWTFAEDSQSAISSRCVQRQAATNNVTRISRTGSQVMQGPDVFLFGQGDIQVARQSRELDGVVREATVLSLRSTGSYREQIDYAGECGRRPDTRSCDGLQPIELLGGVQPDCCGRIFIEFRGCAEMHEISNACGVIITCDTEVDELCPVIYGQPDENGKLPTEWNDPCEIGVTPISGQDITEVNIPDPPPPTTSTTTTTPVPTTTTTTTTTPPPTTTTTTTTTSNVGYCCCCPGFESCRSSSQADCTSLIGNEGRWYPTLQDCLDNCGNTATTTTTTTPAPTTTTTTTTTTGIPVFLVAVPRYVVADTTIGASNIDSPDNTSPNFNLRWVFATDTTNWLNCQAGAFYNTLCGKPSPQPISASTAPLITKVAADSHDIRFDLTPNGAHVSCGGTEPDPTQPSHTRAATALRVDRPVYLQVKFSGKLPGLSSVRSLVRTRSYRIENIVNAGEYVADFYGDNNVFLNLANGAQVTADFVAGVNQTTTDCPATVTPPDGFKGGGFNSVNMPLKPQFPGISHTVSYLLLPGEYDLMLDVFQDTRPTTEAYIDVEIDFYNVCDNAVGGERQYRVWLIKNDASVSDSNISLSADIGTVTPSTATAAQIINTGLIVTMDAAATELTGVFNSGQVYGDVPSIAGSVGPILPTVVSRVPVKLPAVGVCETTTTTTTTTTTPEPTTTTTTTTTTTPEPTTTTTTTTTTTPAPTTTTTTPEPTTTTTTTTPPPTTTTTTTTTPPPTTTTTTTTTSGTLEGACCTWDNTCEIVTESDCMSIFFGNYLGNGTSCSPDPCEGLSTTTSGL